MAITVDLRQSGTTSLPGNVAAQTSMQWTHTLGAALSNGILVVGDCQDAAANSTSVVWDSGGTNVAMTRKGSGTTGNLRAEVWYLLSPVTTGAKLIKVSWSGSHDGNGASASYAGVDQTTIFNAASPQTATGTTTTASLGVTTTSGEMAFNVASKDLGAAGSAPTKGASQNYVGSGVDTVNTTIETCITDQLATTTTTTMTATLPATGNTISLGVSLLPAAAAATDTQEWLVRAASQAPPFGGHVGY